jgi:hypothetical protein
MGNQYLREKGQQRLDESKKGYAGVKAQKLNERGSRPRDHRRERKAGSSLWNFNRHAGTGADGGVTAGCAMPAAA